MKKYPLMVHDIFGHGESIIFSSPYNMMKLCVDSNNHSLYYN